MSEKVESINPYSQNGPKGEAVRRMFNSIAPAYDLMNRLMSLGLDRVWRRRLVREVSAVGPVRILDVATGTGDVAIDMARAVPGAVITGIDLSEGMIDIGRKKIEAAGLARRISLQCGDALALPFDDAAFDVVTVAYGVRNFADLHAGYAEMARVLRPGGKLIVLELTTPRSWFMRPLYALYTRIAVPLVGLLISRDSDAYSYLPRSIRAVPAREAMTAIMDGPMLHNARYASLFPGVCAVYTATRR